MNIELGSEEAGERENARLEAKQMIAPSISEIGCLAPTPDLINKAKKYFDGIFIPLSIPKDILTIAI